jgi:pantoate--beta-alanine ligase
MKVCSGIAEVRDFLANERAERKSIGFVPTMGALHEGHLSLIRRSVEENDLTACSIFVNPIQFNNPSDLKNYPRTLETDLKMLKEAGCDVVFTPGEEEIYPKGETGMVDLDLGHLDKVLEGAHRPGHFKGVVIVVRKLFIITEPDKAYFGKKDYQQLLVIRKMTQEMKLPVEIVPCPIIREPDGLAMSSRNMLLTAEERKIAPRIYETLSGMKERSASLPGDQLKVWAYENLSRFTEFTIEYIEIADKVTLLPVGPDEPLQDALALAAIRLNKIRLIDNIEFFM